MSIWVSDERKIRCMHCGKAPTPGKHVRTWGMYDDTEHPGYERWVCINFTCHHGASEVNEGKPPGEDGRDAVAEFWSCVACDQDKTRDSACPKCGCSCVYT